MEPAAAMLAVATIFARVGGVFLVAPGLSSSHTPMQVRLFLALGLSLAAAPLVLPAAAEAARAAGPADLLVLLGSETLIGLLIGLLARLLLMALQFIAVAIANAVGLAGIPGAVQEEGESGLAVATLFTATAVTVIFVTDLHYEVLRAVIGSYAVVAPGAGLDVREALATLTDRFADVFLVALRLGAPFLIYSVIVNFAVGLTNKLTPALPVFFVATPFIAAGGLVLMAVAFREVMVAFSDAFAQLAAAL
jgi:flagellar biosynthetic protein FliR